jgi:hypothetical protein
MIVDDEFDRILAQIEALPLNFPGENDENYKDHQSG